jgi:dehydrogenase/reductase SDR family protein 4
MENKTTKKYTNKVCLITGSTMGIGLAMAEKFGLEDANVIICSRKKDNLEAAEEKLKSIGIKVDAHVCNVNDKEQRKKLLNSINEKYQKLDVLICNVAVNPHFGNSYDITEREFDKIFEVNVKNTFFTIKESLSLLKNAKNPSVLIISSQAGYTPFSGIGVYSVSKTALFSMTKLLAEELAKFKIRVNCIAPGIIQTKMSQAIIDSDEARLNFMKRPGVPTEIAGAAVFMCSEEASFITGETVCINGGMHGRL